jgi:uncharacterized membrane protein YkvA (DUF1232 family)
MFARLKTWAKRIKRDVLALYLAARDPATPWPVKVLALCIAGYALSPIDLIPDFIPVIGLLDEAILLPIAILGVVKLIPAGDMVRFRAAADTMNGKPASRTAAAIVAVIWLAAGGWTVWFIVHGARSS